MKKKMKRIWVSDEFARALKSRASMEDMNLIDYSKEVAIDFLNDDKKKKKPYKFDF